MKPVTVWVLAVLSLASISSAECHGDNCARAVTGTRANKKPDVTSRWSDCTSFMRTTVTPEAYTSTVTSTIYTDKPPPPPANKRFDGALDLAPRAPETVSPTAVPAYASPCAGPAAYSSACSCWGVTATATTVARPTVTTTTTKYVDVGCKTAAVCPFPDYNVYPCGGNGRGLRARCSCLSAADGSGQKLCVENRECKAAAVCKTSDDCPEGEGCVQNHCCESRGPRICLKYAPKACHNPNSPRGIFERGRKRQNRKGSVEGQSSECTAFGCSGSGAVESK